MAVERNPSTTSPHLVASSRSRRSATASGSSATRSGRKSPPDSGSAHPRGYGDYATSTLKVTASQTTASVASPARDEPAGARVWRQGLEDARLGIGWTNGDHGRGRSHRSAILTVTPWKSTTRSRSMSRRRSRIDAEEPAAEIHRPGRRRALVDHRRRRQGRQTNAKSPPTCSVFQLREQVRSDKGKTENGPG